MNNGDFKGLALMKFNTREESLVNYSKYLHH